MTDLVFVDTNLLIYAFDQGDPPVSMRRPGIGGLSCGKAARASSSRYLLTEDLQADQDFDGLVVLNPFLCDPTMLIPR